MGGDIGINWNVETSASGSSLIVGKPGANEPGHLDLTKRPNVSHAAWEMWIVLLNFPEIFEVCDVLRRFCVYFPPLTCRDSQRFVWKLGRFAHWLRSNLYIGTNQPWNLQTGLYQGESMFELTDPLYRPRWCGCCLLKFRRHESGRHDEVSKGS